MMRTKENDDFIIVNRAQVNAQLAFMSMDTNNKHAKENIQILKCAINNMLEQEKNQRSMAVGAKMTVSQVKQTFSIIEKYLKIPLFKLGRKAINRQSR